MSFDDFLDLTADERSKHHIQLAKMIFDETLDLTAEVGRDEH